MLIRKIVVISRINYVHVDIFILLLLRASQDESIVQKHRHKKNKKHKKQRQKDNKEKITNDANDVEDPKDSPVSVGASEASRMEITDPCNKANHSGFTPEHSLGHHEHFTNAKMNGNETP